MAIYRLEAKIISRGNGHSAVAAAAYRTGTKIRDERADKIHDYSSRTKGVVETVILRPENSPEWTAKTATLWNAVEQGEKRKDAQLSREFILAVPKELSAKEQFQLAVGWAQAELDSKGMIAEVSLHNPKGGKNPHVHILATMRTLDGDKFSAKKPREWNDKALLVHWRESWAKAENDALEKAGRQERVDSQPRRTGPRRPRSGEYRKGGAGHDPVAGTPRPSVSAPDGDLLGAPRRSSLGKKYATTRLPSRASGYAS